MPTLATAPARVVLQTEPEAVAAAAQSLRDTFVPKENRQAPEFREGDLRRTARVSVEIPVEISSVVMSGGEAQILNDAAWGEVVDLSQLGLSFTHADLFMHYFCLVTIALPTAESVTLLVEILWTIRETKEHYRSGGRFIGVIEPAE